MKHYLCMLCLRTVKSAINHLLQTQPSETDHQKIMLWGETGSGTYWQDHVNGAVKISTNETRTESDNLRCAATKTKTKKVAYENLQELLLLAELFKKQNH